MKKSTKKPLLNSLKGSFTIPKEVREALRLPNILFLEAKYWSSVQQVVSDFFENADSWDEDPNKFYSMLLNTFQKISLYKDMPPLAIYAQAQTEHYKNSTIKREFFHQDKKKERAASLIREESNALQEGKIAGAILAGNGARSFGKKQNDVFDDDFVVEQVNFLKETCHYRALMQKVFTGICGPLLSKSAGKYS